MPDAKLLLAMEEIKAVLKAHDIGGVVFLGSKTHTDFLHELTPSWSRLRFAPLPDGSALVRLRAKKEDFPGGAPERDEAIRLTVGLVSGFVDAMNGSLRMMQAVQQRIAQDIEFSHWSREEPPPGES